MSPMLSMLKKELIEYKSVTYAPIVLLLVGGFLLLHLFTSTGTQSNVQLSINTYGDFNALSPLFSSNIYSSINSIIGLFSLALTFTHLSKTLKKERKEGSSPFWRSMPVTSGYTHAVKLIFSLLLIPLIFSLLVLTINLLVWVMSLTNNNLLYLFADQASIALVITTWLDFLGHMALASLALFPIAAMILALSQITNAPIIMLFAVGYITKLFFTWVFNWDGMAQFLNYVYNLSTDVLFSEHPLDTLFSGHPLFLMLYYIMGIFALYITISLYRAPEISWQSLNPNWLLNKLK